MRRLRFHNVDAEPGDEVATWPYEALVTAIDRGLLPDWRPIFAEIRRAPWGPVARRVERYLGYRDPDGTGTRPGRRRAGRNHESGVRSVGGHQRVAAQHVSERQGDPLGGDADAHRARRCDGEGPTRRR